MNTQNVDAKYKNACLWLTLSWLVLFNVICWLGIFSTPESLNEVGDFFAGLFSPIAFLWLIYSYFQNSEALKAQIKEMNDSVDEQRKSVQIQNENLNILKQQLMPKLIINDGKAQKIYLEGVNVESMSFYLSVENLGCGELFNLRIKHENVKRDLIAIKKLDLNNSHEIEFNLKLDVFGEELSSTKIEISYEDLLGQQYYEKYWLTVLQDLNDTLEWYRVLLNIINQSPRS